MVVIVPELFNKPGRSHAEAKAMADQYIVDIINRKPVETVNGDALPEGVDVIPTGIGFHGGTGEEANVMDKYKNEIMLGVVGLVFLLLN